MNAPMATAEAAIGNRANGGRRAERARSRAARNQPTRAAPTAGGPQLETTTMPNWITNELTIAGPKGPIDALDAELWDRERAAKDGNGLVFHVAVPAVPTGTEWNPGYPGGKFGEEAWGCRAVSRAEPHERIPTRSTRGVAGGAPLPVLFRHRTLRVQQHSGASRHASARCTSEAA